MGIDGIGKGGGLPPGATGPGDAVGQKQIGGAQETKETGRTFEVRGEKAQAAPEAHDVAGVTRSPLDRLRAGEIDVNGYVDLKVDAATKNLHGLGRVELEHIRATLKHQMANDPAIVDLVKQATGAVPTPSDE